LIPVVGLGFSVLIGEAVGAAQLVGGTLAVAGVFLGTPPSGGNVDGAVESGPSTARRDKQGQEVVGKLPRRSGGGGLSTVSL
jgi:hypothetical protein